MAESSFITKVAFACQKKEALFDSSKAKYAVRSMYAGAFLTLSTAAGAIAADVINKIVPGWLWASPVSVHICLGIGIYSLLKR